MSAVRGPARLIEPIVHPLAWGAFAFYVFWNVVWITSGRVPPSMLQAFTGIPCPTTGCTRSVLASFQGHWSEAFLWNPFTLVYGLLFAWSAAVLAAQLLKHRRLALSALLSRL